MHFILIIICHLCLVVNLSEADVLVIRQCFPDYTVSVLCFCVLCSAGAGRTGTFVALSNILERVKAEGLLDVFQTVKSLRMQRPHMVQTVVSANISITHQILITVISAFCQNTCCCYWPLSSQPFSKQLSLNRQLNLLINYKQINWS